MTVKDVVRRNSDLFRETFGYQIAQLAESLRCFAYKSQEDNLKETTVLRNLKICYRVHNSAPLNSMLGQMNPVSSFSTRCGFKTKQILYKFLVSLKIPTFCSVTYED